MKQTQAAILASIIAVFSASAQGEAIYGIASTTVGGVPTNLVRFDSAAPLAATTIGAVTGLVAGQQLRGVDFRPSDGLLYGVSSTADGAAGQLYTINLVTGAAAAVGTGFALSGNTSAVVTIDFNPVANALRIVTGSDQSYRVNANTGVLIGQDTSLTPANVQIAGVAYTNNVVGATQTTLYAYDFRSDVLGTIGGINGTPSPNGGAFNPVGASGLTVSNSFVFGFDISGATGIAYASTDTTGEDAEPEFYTVNLGTGLFTQIGDFGTGLFLRDFSVQTVAPAAVPEPGTLSLALLGLVGLGAAVRRRRAAARG